MAIKLGAENVEEKTYPPQLKWPYLGNAQLIDVSAEERKGRNDEPYFSLDFVFMLHGDEDREEGRTSKGVEFLHREYLPREGEKEDTMQNTVDRIAYICKYWFGDENAKKLTQVEGETYEEAFKNLYLKVAKAFRNAKEKGKDYSKKVIRIKVNGSVYQNKAYLRFTKYLGFISDKSSKYPTDFSRKEDTSNQEYVNFVKSGGGSSANGSDSFDMEAGEDEVLDFG